MSDHRPILPQLRDGLAAVDRDPDARVRVVQWGHTEPSLAGVDGATAIVTRCRREGSHTANALLRALLRHAVESDPDGLLARRLILAALAPGLQHAAASLSRAWAADHDEVDQAIVLAALEQVAASAGTNPRWPAHDIVSFARDAVRAQLRRDARRRNRTFLMDQPPDRAAPTVEGPCHDSDATQLLMAAVRQHVISSDAAELIFTTCVLGATPVEVASAYGRSPAAMRRARQRGERALRLAG